MDEAEEIEISGVTGTKLGVIASKVIPISFLPHRLGEFRHPFVVIKDPGQFLLSSHAMYQQALGIRWEKRSGKPLLTWEDPERGPQEVQLHPNPRFTKGVNAHPFELLAGERKMIDFTYAEQENFGLFALV